MEDQVEQRLDVLFLNTGEGDAQIGVAQGDGAYAILVKQERAKRFRVYCLQLQAHEIAGVERVIFPHIAVFAAVEQAFYLICPALHNVEFLLLLRGEIRGSQGVQHEGLRRVRSAGNGGADDPHRFFCSKALSSASLSPA